MWDHVTGRLRWITAGHPRPLVLRHDGRVETLEAGVTRPLGLGAGGLRPGERVLEPGDRLVLYSDGLVEQPHRATGGAVGIDAVHRVLAASPALTCV